MFLINCLNYPGKSSTLKTTDKILTPVRISFGVDKKSYSLGIRILYCLGAFLASPVMLSALTIKWFKRNPKLEKRAVLHGVKKPALPQVPSLPRASLAVLPEDSVIPTNQKSEAVNHREACMALMKEGWAKCEPHDKRLDKPLPGSWRARVPENHQSLDDYASSCTHWSWPDHRPINILRLGNFSEAHLKILNITCTFLSVVYQLPVKLNDAIMTVEQLKEKFIEIVQEKADNAEDPDDKIIFNRRLEHVRKKHSEVLPRADGRYETDALVPVMVNVMCRGATIQEQIQTQCLGLTTEDLYSITLQNFVFGSAGYARGIWSCARFGDPKVDKQSFEKCLMRMMKISIHEFGHMREISHCRNYDCNMGGYMSLDELDARPLTFCAEDTSKLCFMTNTSLLEYNTQLLKFFQEFKQKYDVNCNFSREIQTLSKRVSVIS